MSALEFVFFSVIQRLFDNLEEKTSQPLKKITLEVSYKIDVAHRLMYSTNANSQTIYKVNNKINVMAPFFEFV